jgi:class 3 adenylate cyclase/tetratricopeptide (TPR) repeat protein
MATQVDEHEEGALVSARDLDVYLPDLVSEWVATTPEQRHLVLDGTLIFADVSGFTPLSERLGRQGKEGAERLTDILNDIFAAQLDVSSQYGGDLLKFGGDALLLLFSGAAHAERACAAAVAMQAALAARSRVNTGAGTVTLRMSVGIHSGPVQAYLLGDRHRELIVTGPTTTGTALMEKAADAGEILLSPVTAAFVDPAWVGRAKEGGVLLRPRRVESAHLPRSRPALPPDLAVSCVPEALRHHLSRAPELGEHRQAAIAFLQFRGTDRILERHGAAEVASRLQRLLTVVQTAAARHDVTFLASDLDVDGGKILLSAGAPQAKGDDDDRLVQAVRDVVTSDLPVAVRAGLNRGHAFAVDLGNAERRCFSVMGDVVNVAARLMGHAQDRTLLASDALLSALRTEYQLDHREPLALKGKSEAVAAAAVGAPLGRRQEVRSERPPLVGREAEWLVVGSALVAAREGAGGVIQLVGEPGLGKSRLVEELVAAASGLPVLTVQANQYAAFSPYLAVRAPLRRLVGVEPGDSDTVVASRLTTAVERVAPGLRPWLPLLGLVLGCPVDETPQTATLDEKFRRRQLHDTVTELLLAALGPTAVLVVEDTHWLDDASGDLVRHLARHTTECGWLLLATRRPVADGLDLAGDDGVETLALTPLDAAATAALVARAADATPLAPGLAEVLAERSGGNPLFLRELLDAARAGGTADTLPDTIEATIAARIDTLPPGERALLRRAAVLGDRFPFRLLQALVDEGVNARDAVRRGLADFLVPDAGSVRFRHALLRQVAYEGLPYRVRRDLHLRAGEALEAMARTPAERPLALLSTHFFAAGDHARAWPVTIGAAEQARGSAGHTEAAALYRRALDSARHLPLLAPDEVARTWESLGDVAEKSGDYELAMTAFRSARRLRLGDAGASAELCLKEGRIRELSGAFSQALRWYGKGTRLLEDCPPAQRAALEARLQLAVGAARLRQGRYQEALSHLHRAVAAARPLDDLRTLASAYNLIDWACTDIGSPEAYAYRGKALPIYEQLGDSTGLASTLNNLGVAAYYEGRWDEAVELWERSGVARRAAGDVVLIGEVSNNIAEIRSDQGHWDQAEELLRDALRLWRGTRFPIGIALATSNLGRLATRRGDLDSAAALLAEARAGFDAIGAGRYVLETDCREAERLLLAGRSEEALALAGAAHDVASRRGGVPVVVAMLDRLVGTALVRRGDVDAGRARLEGSVAVAREAKAAFELGQSLLVLAAVFRTWGGGSAPHAEYDAVAVLAGIGVERMVLPTLEHDARHTSTVVSLTDVACGEVDAAGAPDPSPS